MEIIKKLIIAGVGLAVIIFLLCMIEYFFYDLPSAKTEPATLIRSFNVVGKSMEPTLNNGDRVSYNVSLKPEQGNIVAFDCFTPKCINYETPEKVKRLTKVNEQGCYWFEGDNKNFSWDSRNYGWLCGSDVKIQGVVIQ